ncbi:hypothetical protein PCYB_004470, partial [Plasmodium cynomolgi strain B]
HNRHVRCVCSTILNYLNNNNISDNERNKFSICILLNYLAYSTLSVLYYPKKRSELDNACNVLEKIWNERVDDRNNWKQRKELYEYYVDIDGIISTAKFFNTGRNDYYKYVMYKKRLYNCFMNDVLSFIMLNVQIFLRNVKSTIQKCCYLSLYVTKIY